MRVRMGLLRKFWESSRQIVRKVRSVMNREVIWVG